MSMDAGGWIRLRTFYGRGNRLADAPVDLVTAGRRDTSHESRRSKELRPQQREDRAAVCCQNRPATSFHGGAASGRGWGRRAASCRGPTPQRPVASVGEAWGRGRQRRWPSSSVAGDRSGSAWFMRADGLRHWGGVRLRSRMVEGRRKKARRSAVSRERGRGYVRVAREGSGVKNSTGVDRLCVETWVPYVRMSENILGPQ